MINWLRWFVGCVLFFSMSLPVSAAQINGYAWQSMDTTNKALYLKGMFDGVALGESFVATVYHHSGDTALWMDFSHTVEFYLAEIDDWYNLHRDRRNTIVWHILPCMADKPVVTCDRVF